MVNFHKYSVFHYLGPGSYPYSHVGYQPLYFLQNLLARGSKNATVLDLIVICKKKGTIKNSNKIDKFCQMAELCEFEVK